MANGNGVPTQWLPVILFVLAQTGTAVWWASKTSSTIEHLARIVPGISTQVTDNSKEIQRISNMLGEQQLIKETIKGLDVLRYKVDDLVKQMDRINERNLAIEEQHADLFKALQQQGPQQQAQIKGGYAYE